MVFNNGRLAAVLARSETQRTRSVTLSSRSEAHAAAATCGAALLLVTTGCSFELPQIAPLTGSDAPTATITSDNQGDASVDASTSAVTSMEPSMSSSSSSPDAAAPSASAPGDSGPCPVGQALCDGICLAEGACECASGCALPFAKAECDRGECRIIECEDGHLDCDNDANNGCEQAMDLDPDPSGIASVPHLTFAEPFSAITQFDWTPIPGYRLAETCAGCARNPPYNVVPLTPLENAGLPPSPADLQASVKIAWNEQGFWLRLLISDDDWFLRNESIANPAATEAAFVEDPRSFDNVELYWDADGPNGFLEHMDHGLFFSADGSLSQLLLREQGTENVNVTQTELGTTCRVVYAQLTPEFLLNSASEPLVLQAGQGYGFNLGVNDFDVNADTGKPERQHHLFLIPMSVAGMADPYYAGATFESMRITLTE
jgi:hypothetical protein